MDLLPLILATPLLLWMGYSDLRHMRIPNWLVGSLVLVFVVSLPMLTIDSSMARFFTASIVLLFGMAAFALGFLGGGDTKVLGALMLLIPPQTLHEFALVFSLAIVVGLGLVLTLRAVPGAVQARWVGVRAKGMFPLGVSIAIAGLMHPIVVFSLAS